MKKFQIYFFLEELNTINILILKKLKNISLIYRNYSKTNYFERAKEIKHFSKKRNFNLFISNDLMLANKIGAQGIYIPSFNKHLKYIDNQISKKLLVIGSAHSIPEIHFKIKQGCKIVMISPIFATSSHPNKKKLGISKFLYLHNKFKNKVDIIALGGIKEDNINKLQLLYISGFAFKSFLNKIPKSKIINFLNLIAGLKLIRYL